MLKYLLFLITFRYLPKTGRAHQWEETGQVTQRGSWGSHSVWAWLWTGGIREQGLSGESDLERPAAYVQRWERDQRWSSSTWPHCASQRLSSSSPWPSLILLSNPLITFTTLSSSFCNLPLSCSLLPFHFLCVMHVRYISYVIIFPLVVVQRAFWMQWHVIFQPVCPLTARWL